MFIVSEKSNWLSRLYQKATLVALYFLFFNTNLISQNYKVGVPVNKQLYTVTLTLPNGCYPRPEATIYFPISTVTGVNNILIFESVSSKDSIYVGLEHKLVKAGDTLFFTSSRNIYPIYFQKKGKIACKFYSVGIPKIRGEKYNCGDVTFIDDAVKCVGKMDFYYINNLCNGNVE